jgi:hypothetical protein
MAWFKKKEKGITTATEDKMDVPKVFGKVSYRKNY